MNVWYYVLYICLFIISNFLLFHFVLLKAYSPKIFTNKWSDRIFKGIWTGQYLENEDRKRTRGSRIFLPFTLSFYLKNHNYKLKEKYGPDAKINRWRRIGTYWVIVIFAVIIINAILCVWACHGIAKIEPNSISFFEYFAISLILIWGTIFAFVFILATFLWFLLWLDTMILRMKKIKITEKMKKERSFINFFNYIMYLTPFSGPNKRSFKIMEVALPSDREGNPFCISYIIAVFLLTWIMYFISMLIITTN